MPPIRTQSEITQGGSRTSGSQTAGQRDSAPGAAPFAAPVGRDFLQLLLKNSSSDLYAKNGFRVLQLPVTASAREISRRRSTVDKALANELPVPPGSGCALPFAAGSELQEVVLAAQRLSDPDQRIFDEVFWFWPSDDADPAMAGLKEGRVKDAEVIWLEREDDPDYQFIARHNLAVLYHLGAVEAEQAPDADQKAAAITKLWERAYRRWARVVQDAAVWHHLESRVRDLDDPRLVPQAAAQIREGMPRLLTTITAKLAIQAIEAKRSEPAKRLLKTLRASELGQEAVQQGIRLAVAPVRSRITAMCKGAEAAASSNPVRADELCRHLIETGSAIIEVVDSLLEGTDAIRQAAHDELAERIHRCQLAYSKKTCDWAQGVPFLQAALRIAASTTLKKTLEEEIEAVKKNRDRGDDYCAPGYYQAPKEILDPLEAARQHLDTRNYEETVRQLIAFLKEQHTLIRSSQSLPLVRKALAYSLGMRASGRRSRAIAEYNSAMEQHRLGLLKKAASNPSAFLNYGGILHCMACGDRIVGNYKYFTIEGVEIKVCLKHPPPTDAAVNAAIVQSAQDCVDGLFLDSSNKYLVERVAALREECVKESLAYPGVSPWLKTLIGRDANAKMPKAAVPPGKPGTKRRAVVIPPKQGLSKEQRVLVWAGSIAGTGPLGLVIAPALIKWGEDLAVSGKPMTAFWTVCGLASAPGLLLLLSTIFSAIFGGH